jgi:hypothetical protein
MPAVNLRHIEIFHAVMTTISFLHRVAIKRYFLLVRHCGVIRKNSDQHTHCKNDMVTAEPQGDRMPAVNLRHIEIFHAVMTTGNLTDCTVGCRRPRVRSNS